MARLLRLMEQAANVEALFPEKCQHRSRFRLINSDPPVPDQKSPTPHRPFEILHIDTYIRIMPMDTSVLVWIRIIVDTVTKQWRLWWATDCYRVGYPFTRMILQLRITLLLIEIPNVATHVISSTVWWNWTFILSRKTNMSTLNSPLRVNSRPLHNYPFLWL